MMKRTILLSTFIFLFVTSMYCIWHYADRMCKEYMGESLTIDLIQKQLGIMSEGAILPKGEWSYGVDISHHQPLIRWNKLRILVDEEGRTIWDKEKAVRTEPISYVFMKATEGESFRDWRFRRRWKKAREAGISRGAYHFFRPSKSAVSQAQNYIQRVGNLESDDMPPVLDIEKLDDCCKEIVNGRALEWLQIVEKHYGRKPIVYANPHYLNNIIDSRITKNYPIWVANYKVGRPSYSRWKYWQFTDRALVRGAGCVDLNVTRK